MYIYLYTFSTQGLTKTAGTLTPKRVKSNAGEVELIPSGLGTSVWGGGK